MGDLLESPGVIWRGRVALPHDVSYYMKWDTIDTGEVLALERAAIATISNCTDRINFLQSPPYSTFGIIAGDRKTAFIFPAFISLAAVEPLLDRLQQTMSKSLFLINGKSSWTGFQTMCQSTAGQVRGMFEDSKFENPESPAKSVPNMLYPSLLTAIEQGSEKIIIFLPDASEPPEVPVTPEELDIIRDKLTGSLLNITVGISSVGMRGLAEKLISLNKNPYNRIIHNGSSVDVDDAELILQDAKRILQYCKTVRNRNSATKIATQTENETGQTELDFLPPDSRINLPVRDWLKLNGIKARGLDIYKCLDVVGSRQKSYVGVLNKEIESRAMNKVPGLVEVKYPDGTVKLVHYDRSKVQIILEGLGHLLRSLTQIRNSVIERGIGFIPTSEMVIVMELSAETLKYFERFLATSALELTKLVVIIASCNSADSDVEIFSISNGDRTEFIAAANKMYFKLQSQLMIGGPVREFYPVWPTAVKMAMNTVIRDNIQSLSIIYSTKPERPDALIDLINDSQVTRQ